MMEYTKNYENRIKNFIYNMAEKPIQIRENPKQYSTTREEFLIEERDKILFHKGFIFNLYQTDKDRVNAYQNEREKYEEYMQNLLNNQNKKKKNKHNSILINDIDYTQSFSQDNKNNSLLNNNNQIYFKITQPQMRFKPRSDLERIYNVIENHQSNNFSNIDDNKGKNIVKRHLNKMGFKAKIEEQGKSAEDIIEEKKFEIIEELINGPKKDDNKKKKKERKKFDVISKMNNRKVDNSNAKSFYPDLYYKTYFNAVENYSLFKNSCFLPNKFNYDNHLNHTNYNVNKSENEKKNKTLKNFNFHKINNRKINENKNIEKYNNNNNINKNKSQLSTLDLINYFNNNSNNYSQNDDKFIKSLDNIDLFTKGVKENKHKLTKKEQTNFDIIKSMAFEKKKRKFFIPVYDNQNEEKNDNKSTNINNNNTNNDNDIKSNINDEDDEDANEDYYIRKNEEKIKIDGIEYRKNDLENLSKAIMSKCKYTRHKFRDSDSNYSKNGQGKLMFTNGLTVEEFEKKYHIKG